MRFVVKLVGGDTKYDVTIKKGTYGNGRVALELIGLQNGAPFAVITVNLPEYTVRDGLVLIKNWSENEGLMEQLQAYGVLGPSIAKVPTGYVYADLCELYPESQWQGIEADAKREVNGGWAGDEVDKSGRRPSGGFKDHSAARPLE